VGTWTGSAYDGVTARSPPAAIGGGGTAQRHHHLHRQRQLTTLGVRERQKFTSDRPTRAIRRQTVDARRAREIHLRRRRQPRRQVDVDDYGRSTSTIPLGTATGSTGTSTYDGVINVDDYGIIDFNVGIQRWIL
jgi:hypothetical protein